MRNLSKHSRVARSPLGKNFLNMISLSGSLDPENSHVSWRRGGFSKGSGAVVEGNGSLNLDLGCQIVIS